MIRTAWDDVLVGMKPIVVGRRPFPPMMAMIAAMIVTWFIYVPIHELLHVGGCLVTGGEVGTLQIKPMYGGHVLARVFPFVKAEGSYAGRLSDFDTHGSDLIYLSTDFGPFLLSILIGVPLLRWCGRGRHPLLFGAGVVVGLAPFYNLPGDYFEMGSILVTRVMTELIGGAKVWNESLRSDDVFALIESIFRNPAGIGLSPIRGRVTGMFVVIAATGTGIVLALVTYALGDLVARFLVGPPRRPTLEVAHRRAPGPRPVA